MVTFNQLVRKPRKEKFRRFKLLGLNGAPLRKGICVRVTVTNPKKPNSAIRKIARVRLSSKKVITASIPGQGHSLQEHSVVLVRGGRCRDVPGLRYKLIRGKYDFDWREKFSRMQRRSKFSIPFTKKKI